MWPRSCRMPTPPTSSAASFETPPVMAPYVSCTFGMATSIRRHSRSSLSACLVMAGYLTSRVWCAGCPGKTDVGPDFGRVRPNTDSATVSPGKPEYKTSFVKVPVVIGRCGRLGRSSS